MRVWTWKTGTEGAEDDSSVSGLAALGMGRSSVRKREKEHVCGGM